MKLSSLVVLLAASGDAKPSPEARAALKAKKNTQDLAWELLFKSGKLWGIILDCTHWFRVEER